MARPIKETPILTGRDAVNFYKEMKINNTRKVSEFDLSRMKENYNKLKSISDGHIFR